MFKNSKTIPVINTKVSAKRICVLLYGPNFGLLFFEIIANAPLRHNVIWLCRIFLQLFPKPADVYIYGADITAIVVAPNSIQQDFAGIDPVCVPHQKLHNIEFLCGEFHQSAGYKGVARIQVQ